MLVISVSACSKSGSNGGPHDGAAGADAKSNGGGPDGSGGPQPGADSGPIIGGEDGGTTGPTDGGEVPPNANVMVGGKLVALGPYLAMVTYPLGVEPGRDGGMTDTGTTGRDGGGLGDGGAIADAGLADTGTVGDAGPRDTGTLGQDAGGIPPEAMIGVGAASLLAIGTSPPAATVSSDVEATKGDYTVSLPQNGKVVMFANKAGYFPSYTGVTTYAVNVNNQHVFIASSSWVNSIAAQYQINLATPFHCSPNGSLSPMDTCVYAIIVGQIMDDGSAGSPRPFAGVKGQEIEIVGGDNNGPWIARGPYFLTSTGTPSLNAIQSVTQVDTVQRTVRGGLFVAFVEIPQLSGPPGVDFRIAIRHDAGGGLVRYFGPAVVKGFRPYGVSFVQVAETGAPPPMMQMGIDFATQVYPLTLPVSQGGLGCQGCHTSAGGVQPAGGMDLSGGPMMAYMRALDPQMHMNRVNVMNPPASLILVNPLYNPAGNNNHPIIAFTSVQDPSYKTILQWITEGAKPSTGTSSHAAVGFAANVAPIFQNDSRNGGAGCVVCHSGATPPAGFDVTGPVNSLYNALVNQPATDQTTGQRYRIDKNAGDEALSLVLTKPLQGNPAVHPVKLFSSNADPRYLVIYRWIAEGYPNN